MVAYSLLTERSLWVPIVWSRCYRTVQIPGGIQVESKTFSKNKHGGLAGHLKGDNLSEIIKFPPSTLLVQISWNPDFYQVRLRLTAMCLGPYSVRSLRDKTVRKYTWLDFTVRQATAGKHRHYILGLYILNE